MLLALHHVTCLNTEMKVIFSLFLVVQFDFDFS